MNFKQKLVVVMMDLALLAQLTFSIYLAQQDPAETVFVFFKAFIPMVIFTLVVGRIFIKRLRTAEEPVPSSREEPRMP